MPVGVEARIFGDCRTKSIPTIQDARLLFSLQLLLVAVSVCWYLLRNLHRPKNLLRLPFLLLLGERLYPLHVFECFHNDWIGFMLKNSVQK